MLPVSLLLVCLAASAGHDTARPDAGPSQVDPRRALADRTPAAASAVVRKLPPSQQFGAAFAYGEGAGLHDDLPSLVARAKALPVGLQGPFIDGAAHTWAPPPRVPVEAVGTRIAADVPQPWRRPFHNGVLVSWSIAHDADPAEVMPRAEAYAAATGVPVQDGVRVGLQRALGDDLPAALAVAGQYPEDEQAALFEELGWRAGDEAQAVCGLVAAVPDAQRCAFVHGAARGRTLRTDWEGPEAASPLARTVSAEACGCEAAAWRGVAWGLALEWGHRPNRARTLARRIDGAVPGADVARQVEPLLDGARGTPWDGIPE